MHRRLSTHRPQPPKRRRGFSLLELLAVITLMGIVAVIAVPRIGSQSQKAKVTACDVQRGNIEVQAQLWFRNRGRWPARDLNDIAGNADYLPDGLPICPVDGSTYVFDSAKQQVIEHDHAE